MADHPFTRNGEKRDPTPNVFDLVDAATKRQDDLRELTDRLRAEMDVLRDNHSKEIRELESKRLDANRQFDQLSVRTESERAATAITALAATARQIEETLRAMVTSTAATLAKQTADTFTAVTDRIGKLEITQSEGRGKDTVSDPQMADLLMAVKALSQAQSVGVGKSLGGSQFWGYLVGAIGAVAALLMLLDRLK